MYVFHIDAEFIHTYIYILFSISNAKFPNMILLFVYGSKRVEAVIKLIL